jgi:hypothetical protein
MKFIYASLFAGLALAQGVTDKISPSSAPPAGCQKTFSGKFQVTVVNVVSGKRDLGLEKRAACPDDGTLLVSLADGVLTDAKSRIGYIADNRQFQFDGPPQTGAIYTAGWSVCGNSSLALGGSTVFYQCLSGTFYNLYDQNWAPQCEPVGILALPCGGSNAQVSQGNDGQVVGTTLVQTTIVVPLSDGQPQVITTMVPITQIGDGQIQATGVPPPVTQISDGQIQVTGTPPAITQISDGQIQATGKPTVVTQISDGQIQATGSAPVITQISDGQVQATGKPTVVTQISDGQIQATGSAPVITQISDGQIQATGKPTVVTQISDGQVQVPQSTLATVPAANTSTPVISSPTPSAISTNDAGVLNARSLVALLVGVAGVALL